MTGTQAPPVFYILLLFEVLFSEAGGLGSSSACLHEVEVENGFTGTALDDTGELPDWHVDEFLGDAAYR